MVMGIRESVAAPRISAATAPSLSRDHRHEDRTGAAAGGKTAAIGR